MYTLIIVDDELIILEQLNQIIYWEDMGFRVSGCFTCVHDTIMHLEENKTDVLLTDINLGNKTGLDLAAIVRERWPDTIVVFLSGYSEFEYARIALRYQVFEYLLKPVTYEGISTCFTAIRRKLDAASDKKTPVGGQKFDSDDYRINLVKKYIDKHVGDDISLESMANLVSMNPAYFSRFFKKHTTQNYSDYVTECRMEKAISLLKDPNYRIFEICTLVGYFSKQNFYNQFRRYTGCTPIEYRNKVLKIEDYDDDEQY